MWPEVDLESIRNSVHREIFKNRRELIRLYLIERKPIRELFARFKVAPQQLYRFRDRFLSIHPDGNIWGPRALIVGIRVNSNHYYADKKRTYRPGGAGLAGMFEMLLDRFPQLKTWIADLFFARARGSAPAEERIEIRRIHRSFKTQCRSLGLKTSDYPLNTLDCGLRTLHRYLHKLSMENPREAADTRGSEDAQTNLKIWSLTPLQRSLRIQPYQIVELDGCQLNLFIVLEIIDPKGRLTSRVLNRPWVIVLTDITSHAVLSYHLCLGVQYSAADALACIKHSVIPWKPRDFFIPGIKYEDGTGFPSSLIPGLRWALWDELQFDNFTANLAKQVRRQVEENLGCVVHPGRPAHPQERGHVESIGRFIQGELADRLPSATGKRSSDPRRRDAENQAKRYHVSFEHLTELAEVVFASYNGTPHDDLNGDTPLECLERWALHPETVIRHLPSEKHSTMNILPLRVECTVRGSLKHARLPFIHWRGVPYTSVPLKRRCSLISKKMTLWVDTDDLRKVRAFLPDGSEFGILSAKGAWGEVPHDLRMRNLLLSLRRRKRIYFSDSQDWRPAYAEYCRGIMLKDRRAATEYARAQHKGFLTDQNATHKTTRNKSAAHPTFGRAVKPRDYVGELGIDPNEIL